MFFQQGGHWYKAKNHVEDSFQVIFTQLVLSFSTQNVISNGSWMDGLFSDVHFF